jgi:phospholipid/cholesterol/gamma-HCH transport system ATP-binding protein
MPAPPIVVQSENTPSESPVREAISFQDVAIGFERNEVLRGITFQLAKGESKAIFGVAGSGKSTILKLAIGLIKPDSGHIRTLGEEVTEMPEQELFELRRRVGIVFQESALFDSLTVRENVAFRLYEEEVLRFVELEHTLELFPAELSGGMRRRVAIARAIITQPEVILYDSPTGGLDPVTSTTIIELIVKQRDVFKTSSLLVTHRLQDAFVMATHYFDRKQNCMKPLPPGERGEVPMSFLILRDGKVIFDGGAQELAHTRDEYIREYIS